jgi:16S rRNA C967 or C1407 C5-methylase (RsmB/RsmF family)
VVRAVLYCARHEDELDAAFGMANHDRYVLGQLKSNLGPRARFGIKYHIESEHVGHDEDLDLPIWNSKVVWDGLTDESIQEIVAAQEKRKAKSPNVETAQGKAEKWLQAYLSTNGPTPSAKVKAMAGRDGHSEASVKRAKDALDVVITKIPETRNATKWELPQHPTPTTPLVELIRK